MSSVFDHLEEWIKELLLSLLQILMTNAGEFLDIGFTDGIDDLYTTPSNIVGVSAMEMINKVTDVAVTPIAYAILSFVLCYELITAVIGKNSFNEFDTSVIIRWVIKSAIGMYILSKATTVANAFFEVGSELTSKAGTAISSLDTTKFETLASNPLLEEQSLGFLLMLTLLALILQVVVIAIYIVILVVLIGRTVEVLIYCAMAPIPFSAMINREFGTMGTNYLKTLGALAFQTILIMIVLGIFVGLMSGVLTSLTDSIDELPKQLLNCIAYGVVLCFTLLKTGNIAKSVFQAH